MAKKILLFLFSVLGCALLIVGPLALVKTAQIKKMIAAGAAMVMPPTPVTAWLRPYVRRPGAHVDRTETPVHAPPRSMRKVTTDTALLTLTEES